MVRRIFFVLTVGHTGSAWLAKVLNGHFDVMCFHEPEFATYAEGWPPKHRSYFHFTDEEKLRNVFYLFSPTQRYGQSYPVLGACCTSLYGDASDLLAEVSRGHLGAPPETRFFTLLRHPVNQVESSAAALQTMAGLEPWGPFHRSLSLEVLWRLEGARRAALLPVLDSEDVAELSFLHACLHYLRLLRNARDLAGRVSYPSILRLESLATDPEALREALQEITGLDYELPGEVLAKVNAKSGARPPAEVVASWPAARRRVFATVFGAEAPQLEALGYGLAGCGLGPVRAAA